MYLIIGNQNCSRCEVVKNKLTNENIPFEYKLLENYTENEQKHYLDLARQAKQMAMPIIIKDGVVVTLKEVK